MIKLKRGRIMEAIVNKQINNKLVEISKVL